jgi:predicted esterase
LSALLASCDTAQRSPIAASETAGRAVEPDDPEGLKLTPASRFEPERRSPRISVEEVVLSGGEDVSILRGARGTDRIAFLHGLCGHGMGYLQSFQFAAAEHGLAVAPNGDMKCPHGDQRSWTVDLEAIDALIVASLVAAGSEPDPRGVTLIGYSLGATRAEHVARNHPERYDALVLIGAPSTPSPRGLSQLRAAAMIAGERDRQDLMKRGARAFAAVGIPSRFFELPKARHGEMGPDSERVMRDVFRWVTSRP